MRKQLQAIEVYERTVAGDIIYKSTAVGTLFVDSISISIR